MENHRESRKRLRPWLERMINSRECPGLIWDNYEERTFRMPWRHFNNKDWVSRDSQIFKEWAKYTGRYQEGDEPEYPVWKTRLRCALKKIPEIKELKELHRLEDPNPYRVYQFVDPPAPAHRRGDPLGEDTDGSMASPACSALVFSDSPYRRDFADDSRTPPPPNFLEEKMNCHIQSTNVPTVIYENEFGVNGFSNLAREGKGLFFQPSVTKARPSPPPLPLRMTHTVDSDNTTAVPEMAKYPSFNLHPGDNLMNQITPASSQDCNTGGITVMMMDQPGQPIVAIDRPAEIKVEPQLEYAENKTSLPSDLMSLEYGDLCPLDLNQEISLPSNFSSDDQANTAIRREPPLQLYVFFGSPAIDVGRQVVDERGCRLYFAETQVSLKDTFIEEKMYGPKNVMQVKMPAADNYSEISQEQKRFIKELLSCMERGLVLTLNNGDVYAHRLCRTRVFVTDGVQESKLLERGNENPTKVFDFNEFKAAFQKYLQKETEVIPKPFFYLTFGLEIKKSHANPLSRTLIYVKVQHTEASHMVSILSETNTCSSLYPLVSNLNTDDQLLDKFKKMSVQN